MDNATSWAELLEAQNVAAFSSLDTAISAAETKEAIFGKKLSAEEKQVLDIAKKLDHYRNYYDGSMTKSISAFHDRVADEHKELDDNVDYLKKHEMFNYQKKLNLIQQSLKLLQSQSRKTDRSLVRFFLKSRAGFLL